MGRQLDLNRIVLIGRTFKEYHSMFNLRDFEYPEEEKFLDAGGGVSSFTAEANAGGWNVASADEIYYMDAGTLEKKCAADLEEVMKKLEPVSDLYKWTAFKDIPDLKSTREKAYRVFIEDYIREGKGRYVNASLPESAFKDGEFTVTLVSHFLFLYEKELDLAAHEAIIRELLRITRKEIRIFPVTNMEGKRSVFVDALIQNSSFSGVKFEIKRSGYEFLKGANEFLRIVKV